MYGGVQKNQAQIEADQKLIDSVADIGVTREEGAKKFAGIASDYLRQGNISVAIKRYNQSWLLDSDCYEAYWGFAIVYLVRDKDVANAEEMFAKAASYEPDKGNFYVEYGRFNEETGRIDEAINLFEKGLSINPKIRDGYVGLIKCNAVKEDMEQISYWLNQGAAQKAISPEEEAEFRKVLSQEVNNQ